jgi:hypothetical protein
MHPPLHNSVLHYTSKIQLFWMWNKIRLYLQDSSSRHFLQRKDGHSSHLPPMPQTEVMYSADKFAHQLSRNCPNLNSTHTNEECNNNHAQSMLPDTDNTDYIKSKKSIKSLSLVSLIMRNLYAPSAVDADEIKISANSHIILHNAPVND